VIGTNLFLAALMMLPFAVAAEFFTRTLAENEETLKRRIRPMNWFARLQERLGGFFGKRLGKTRFGDILKVAGVMIFYGLVFSLLDKTWNPFSWKGLILFLSMTIAYGVVGVADDIVQWRRIRRWGLHADLKIRPTNMLLAAISMASTRILSLVPGLMFGTPEALDTDEKQFDETKRNTLLRISGITFIVIGLAVWLPTVITGLLLKSSLPETASNLLGGLEAVLLIIFAVALENLFVQMLGFPGSFGQALKRRSRWLWIGLLVLVAFVFYHTLINPRGELAAALEEGNVILFLSVAAAFVVITFGMRIFFHFRNRRLTVREAIPAPAATPEPAAASQAIPSLRPATEPPQAVPEAAPAPSVPSLVTPPPAIVTAAPVAEAEKTPPAVPLAGQKQCPACGEVIKLEARICRHCRATFEVRQKGYCLTDHDVVEVNEVGKCVRCGNDAADIHFESTFLKAPPRPAAPAQPAAPAAPAQPVTSAPRKKKTWIGWLAGGLLGLGLLIILAAAGYLAIQNGWLRPSPTPSATPTRTPLPSSTPNQAATQQMRNANATATNQAAWVQGLAQISSHQPNFEDDFSVTSGRYLRWSEFTTGVTFGDGVLHFNTTGMNRSAAGGSLIATNFVLRYEFTPVTIGSGSAICSDLRAGNDGLYHFCVSLSDDGWGMGSSPNGDDWYGILEGGGNGVSANHTTRITIFARGDEFTFYIDDRFVGYKKDNSYNGNLTNIVIWTPNDVTAVDVDNVQFWDLDNLKP
jgi:hypothetical protein